ncbi:hypothetical protein Tco_0316011 [Tanacetum coccineum]
MMRIKTEEPFCWIKPGSRDRRARKEPSHQCSNEKTLRQLASNDGSNINTSLLAIAHTEEPKAQTRIWKKNPHIREYARDVYSKRRIIAVMKL